MKEEIIDYPVYKETGVSVSEHSLNSLLESGMWLDATSALNHLMRVEISKESERLKKRSENRDLPGVPL